MEFKDAHLRYRAQHRWWEFKKPRGKKYQFYYHTDRIQLSDGRMRYGAWVVSLTKGGTGKLIKLRWFVRRWKAKDWAYKQFCEKKGIEFKTLHRISESRREHGRKMAKKWKERKEVQKFKEKSEVNGKSFHFGRLVEVEKEKEGR